MYQFRSGVTLCPTKTAPTEGLEPSEDRGAANEPRCYLLTVRNDCRSGSRASPKCLRGQGDIRIQTTMQRRLLPAIGRFLALEWAWRPWADDRSTPGSQRGTVSAHIGWAHAAQLWGSSPVVRFICLSRSIRVSVTKAAQATTLVRIVSQLNSLCASHSLCAEPASGGAVTVKFLFRNTRAACRCRRSISSILPSRRPPQWR